MPGDFQREYLLRLPLPLAQLYSRAHNAKEPRSWHDNSYYLCEALVKLAASATVAGYLNDVGHDEAAWGRHSCLPGRQECLPHSETIDRLLAQLALPSFGQWVAIMRECSR